MQQVPQDLAGVDGGDEMTKYYPCNNCGEDVYLYEFRQYRHRGTGRQHCHSAIAIPRHLTENGSWAVEDEKLKREGN